MYQPGNQVNDPLTKRQREVLERLEQGFGVKEIANDLGVTRNAVYQHVERLRRQGALAESYTPSGQPPRRTPRSAASALRRRSPRGRAGSSACASSPPPGPIRRGATTPRRSERRSRPVTSPGSPMSSAGSMPLGEAGVCEGPRRVGASPAFGPAD